MSKFLSPLIVSLTVAGYPLSAIISVMLGFIEDSLSTYIYRSIIALLSMFVLVFFLLNVFTKNLEVKINRHLLVYIVAFIFFCIYYLIRLKWDFDIENIETIIDPQKYYIMFIFAVFLPSLAILLNNKFNFELTYNITFTVLIISVILNIIYGANDYLVIQMVENSRFNNEKLNPISFGHLCASLLIMCIYSRVFRNNKNFLVIIIAILSTVGMLLANSKGPILSFGIVIIYIINIKLQYSFIKKIFFIIFFMLISYLFVYLAKDFIGIDIIGRFLNISSSTNESSSSRLYNYNLAIQQFFDSPIYGDAIVVREAKGYPHNIIIEVLMALGLIGGILFLYFSVLAIYCMKFIARIAKHHLWINCIFLQYFFAAQTSGAIWSVNIFWVLLSLVVVTKFNLINNTDKLKT